MRVNRICATGWMRGRALSGGLVLVVLAAVQLFVLKALPYSSSWLSKATLNLDRPSPDFRVGAIRWDVRAYSEATELEPLRAYFNATCPGQSGLKAAVSITRDLNNRFGFGEPDLDFLNPSYSLLDDYREHVEKGKPGHCVTYSGLLTATLLSAGCPARVVQVYSLSGGGHNIVEIWDDEIGWVLIDPSQKAIIQTATKRIAQDDVEEIHDGETKVVQVGGIFSKEGKQNPIRYLDANDGVLKGPRVYPEPWLYLRCGQKAAPWPFRGAFAVVGRRPLYLGIAQRILDVSIPATTIVGVVALLCAALRLVRSRVSLSQSLSARPATDRDMMTSTCPVISSAAAVTLHEPPHPQPDSL
jgi:Transglutaminase-like superfamily